MKDGKIISDNIAGVNQILPHRNKWAWDMFIQGQADNWVPNEVPMAKDISDWRSSTVLSVDEKLLVRRCLGFFAGSESLVANNLLLSIFKYVTDPECRQYLLLQAMQEAVHNQTIVYICDSLDLDITDVYEAYQNIPSIKAKDDFLMGITTNLNRPDYTTKTIQGKRELLRNIVSYYIICEGIFFFSGFAMLLSFGRQNKLPGISEQIQFTLRDEGVHIQFGTELIHHIREQNPRVWTKEFEEETLAHIHKASELEVTYAHDVLPRGVLGLNAPMFIEYVKYIANRRLEALGMEQVYGKQNNPFTWLSETIELRKQKNFFESRVTEYQTGGATLADDF